MHLSHLDFPRYTTSRAIAGVAIDLGSKDVANGAVIDALDSVWILSRKAYFEGKFVIIWLQ